MVAQQAIWLRCGLCQATFGYGFGHLEFPGPGPPGRRRPAEPLFEQYPLWPSKFSLGNPAAGDVVRGLLGCKRYSRRRRSGAGELYRPEHSGAFYSLHAQLPEFRLQWDRRHQRLTAYLPVAPGPPFLPAQPAARLEFRLAILRLP